MLIASVYLLDVVDAARAVGTHGGNQQGDTCSDIRARHSSATKFDLPVVAYDNSGLRPQELGSFGEIDLGLRQPVFDIRVLPAKSSAYTRLTQNELALQFYQLGFFAQEQSDQALACMSMMEFEGKDELMQRLAANGTMQRELALYQQYALTLTQKYEPERAEALMAGITGRQSAAPHGQLHGKSTQHEAARIERARVHAASVGQPGGGR